MRTPRERATVEVDSPRRNRATAANRRASNFSASRRSYPRCLGMFQPSWRKPVLHICSTGQGPTRFQVVVPGRSEEGPPRQDGYRLEVEAQFHRLRARGDIVCPAARGQEVVKRGLVHHVDDGHTRAPFVPVAMEEVVLAQGEIKEVARLDPLRIVVVVFGVWSRYFEEYGSERSCGARGKRVRSRRCQWVWSN